jgi:hypothetical protein
MAGWNGANGYLGLGGAGMVGNGLNMISSAAPGATTANNIGTAAAEGLAGGVSNDANEYLTRTASGANVTNDPAFQQVLDTFAKGAQSATDGAFGAAGRYGSGANANAFDSAIANEAGQLAYGNFQQQEQNQLAAAGQLSANNTNSTNQQLAAIGQIPGLVSSSFVPGAAVSAAGYGPLQQYINAITAGNGGGTTANTGSYNQNGTAKSVFDQNSSGTQTGSGSQSGTNWNVNFATLLAALA